MKHLFFLRILTIVLATTDYAIASSHASTAEVAAWRWLGLHGQAPGVEDLAELKGTNPEAYAIVQALLTKQSMGLIKRNHHGASPPMPEEEFPLAPAPAENGSPAGGPSPSMPAGMEIRNGPYPLAPKMLDPVKPEIEAQGPPPQELVGSKFPESEILPKLPPLPPTPIPAMPPPPPISPPLPPELPDLALSSPGPAPGPAEELASAPAPVALPVLPVRLSAAATSTAVSGGHSWLNWHPDDMIAENEKMVQNVLGAVAQLTGRHAHRGAIAARDSDDAEPAKLDMPQAPVVEETPHQSTPAALVHPTAVEEVRPRRLQVAKVPAEKPKPVVATPAVANDEHEAPKVQSPADLYLHSTEASSTEQKTHVVEQDTAADDIAGHLPGSVSWSNPYTFTASAHAQGGSSKQDNSYLNTVDLGAPQVALPVKKTPDDENPYLQGLDLSGSSPQTSQASISPSALSAMHQSQLLTSHRLLSSFDWGDKPQQAHKPEMVHKQGKAPKDPLGGFLGSHKNKQPKNPPAMVSKNAYLAKLDASESTAASYSSSSALASNIEDSNPYLQALDGSNVATASQQLQAPSQDQLQPKPQVAKKPEVHDRLADFKWDDSPSSSRTTSHQASHQLAMTSAKVQQKAVTKTQQTVGKKKKNMLSGWLKGAASDKVPNEKARRLQEAIAQRVADEKNPYLKGLDIDSDIAKVPVRQEQGNPYMTSLS